MIVQKGVYRQFADRLIYRAQRLKVGNGQDESVEVGPQINELQVATTEKYVQIGKNEGAKLEAGGKALNTPDHAYGWFFEPTIFTDVNEKMRIAQEEIFGPVLSLIPVESFDQAIEIANGVTYGLSSSVYTRDVNKAFRAMRDIYARHHLRERANDRGGSPSAIRGDQVNRQWTPRRRAGSSGLLHAVEINLYRFL